MHENSSGDDHSQPDKVQPNWNHPFRVLTRAITVTSEVGNVTHEDTKSDKDLEEDNQLTSDTSWRAFRDEHRCDDREQTDGQPRDNSPNQDLNPAGLNNRSNLDQSPNGVNGTANEDGLLSPNLVSNLGQQHTTKCTTQVEHGDDTTDNPRIDGGSTSGFRQRTETCLEGREVNNATGSTHIPTKGKPCERVCNG
ncbi:hypothetical protein WICPIJ_002606 [Wickerhamomyces pijperi]|uniref:Uncharacterized protein n=1 Tax=Wickerhamomyces pijperi TaxID=599730 RepID=A0A9P8QBD9_WICPI|nr:hypothetical protein WICPIJ_002606 [Wickerhamomyces pijperi]